MIVMSSAYRQSGLHTAKKMEADPFNRLMSRGPRLRLSAEQIRDQALFIAGILNQERISGPSVPLIFRRAFWPVFGGINGKQGCGSVSP